jgi:hypothetical protein
LLLTGGNVPKVLESLMKVRKVTRITDIVRKENSMTDKEKLDAIRAEIHRLVDVRGFDREMANDLFAFMDSLPNEPVSDDLEKVVEEIVDPTVLNAYGTKELARRLRNTICGTSVSEDLGEYINELSKQFPEVSFAKLSRIAVRVAKWQKQQDQSTIELAEDHAMFAGMEKMKEQMMAKAIDAHCFGFQGAALFSFRLPASNYLVGSEVKVIVIKED